jgi:hypothetical protein
MHFWRKIFYTVVVLPDTEPQYLHTICLNYFFQHAEMINSFFQHAEMIQNKFQLNSSKSSGPVVNTITLLVAYICLSPGFLKMSGISRALTDWLCANRWPYQLGWVPVKVRIGCRQGSCKLIVSKNVMCTQSCVILCWINSD